MNEIQKYDNEKDRVKSLVDVAGSFKIVNEADFKTGIALVVDAKQTLKRIEESELAQAKQKAFEAHKQVAGIYKSVTEAITGAVDVCLSKMQRYLESRQSKPDDERLSYRQTWGAEVTDIKALCRAIADGECSPDLVKADMTALNRLARSAKDFLKVAGVSAVCKTSLVFKSQDGDE